MLDFMTVGASGEPVLNWRGLTRDQAAALQEVTVVRCLALRQPARFFFMYSTAHSRKVRPLASETRCAWRSVSFASIGSTPSYHCFRCAVALARASASEISGRGPSPMSRRLPSSWKRKTQDLAPLAETRR